MALFTVDWEDWNDALHIEGISLIHEPTIFLLETLDKYDISATFYVLGKTVEKNPDTYNEIVSRGVHSIKSHGYYHYRYEDADRKPYANMGFTGGFYFRAFPYWFIKREVERSGNFYLHPHDVMLYHPPLKNKILDFKRHVGLKQSRFKLDRLMEEVEWDAANLQVRN